MARQTKPTKATTIWLSPEDLQVVAKLRERLKLEGMGPGQVVRISMRRLLEETHAA